MSLASVRPFFEKCAKSAGFKTSAEAFSTETLSKTSGKVAFIDLAPAAGVRANTHMEFTQVATITLFIGQSRDTKDLEAKGYTIGEEFVGECFRASQGSRIARITCTRLEPQPINQNNDNAVTVMLDFEIMVISDF